MQLFVLLFCFCSLEHAAAGAVAEEVLCSICTVVAFGGQQKD